MLLKVRQVLDGFQFPSPVKENGDEVLEAPGVGKLARVPNEYFERCERIVGTLVMSPYPIGVWIELDSPNDSINGLWVQPGVLDHVRNENGRAQSA